MIETRSVPSPVQNEWLSGTVESIELQTGMLVLRAFKPNSPDTQRIQLAVHPKNTQVSHPGFGMKRLEDLKPGQTVSVESTTMEGDRFARTIVIQED